MPIRLYLLLTLIATPTVCVRLAPAQQVARGSDWAIATGHPDSTAAGVQVLRDGGNVIDAAVAASLTLGVAEPYGSGLGGKLVLLYLDGSTGKVSCIEALCPSPLATDPEAFAALPSRKRKYGYTSVCVPGLPAGLGAAHEKWGSLPWADLVEPSRQLAAEGIVVSEAMRSLWAPHEKDLAADAEASRWFLVDGKTPAVGDKLPNDDLAATLGRIAEHGANEFYRGETAKRVVAAAQEAGSPLTLEDFASYEPRFTEPLATPYRGNMVYSSPPPLVGGVTVLAALRASEGIAAEPPGERDAEYIDRLGRVLQVFYPRISREIADVDAAQGAARAMLDRDAIREAVEGLKESGAVSATSRLLDEATLDDAPGVGTTHLVVADAEGNLVSLTQSLSLHFGAAVVPPGTGVVLNDSMSNFATRWKESPNYIAGGKRPRSTVAPVIATRDGLPRLALGIPGGQRIPTTTLQLLVDALGAGVPIDETFARSRFHLRRPLSSRQPNNVIDLEESGDAPQMGELRAELHQLGWETELKPHNGRYFGGGNAILVSPNGSLTAVADSRRTNHAAAE